MSWTPEQYLEQVKAKWCHVCGKSRSGSEKLIRMIEDLIWDRFMPIYRLVWRLMVKRAIIELRHNMARQIRGYFAMKEEL